jgi:flagellar L-ring protein precursor FlgH
MRILALSISMILLCSCASVGKLIKELAGSPPAPVKKVEEPPKDAFSQNNDFQAYPLPERKYGRMTRETFEQEAKVESDAGSLWVEEGQGSYLFSQNQKRLEGDVLNVNLESQALDQLNSKMNVIADLLRQKEEAMQKRQLASEAAASDGKAAATPTPAPAPTADAGKKEDIGIKQVPTRVIATYPDGSYRVKGTKNIMIGNREFQVLVTGLVKGNDIAEDAISSAKLLDSKFDIITNRKVQ